MLAPEPILRDKAKRIDLGVGTIKNVQGWNEGLSEQLPLSADNRRKGKKKHNEQMTKEFPIRRLRQ